MACACEARFSRPRAGKRKRGLMALIELLRVCSSLGGQSINGTRDGLLCEPTERCELCGVTRDVSLVRGSRALPRGTQEPLNH